jgi:hypothetical protein
MTSPRDGWRAMLWALAALVAFAVTVAALVMAKGW